VRRHWLAIKKWPAGSSQRAFLLADRGYDADWIRELAMKKGQGASGLVQDALPIRYYRLFRNRPAG
jgi:hypothetical protein